MRLGVNVDHVATVRQARRANEPDPVAAALAAELGGADSIVVHLRADRRHIQDRDLRLLRAVVTTRLNLEMGLADEIVAIALEVRPDQVTLVPERREELTTEGGLDAVAEHDRLAAVLPRFRAAGIAVSLFLDPVRAQLECARSLGADAVEVHTGAYANARVPEDRRRELLRVTEAGLIARTGRLACAAGHGLTYRNVGEVARLPNLEELNIGHSIVARALLVGMTQAVREMKALIQNPDRVA